MVKNWEYANEKQKLHCSLRMHKNNCSGNNRYNYIKMFIVKKYDQQKKRII